MTIFVDTQHRPGHSGDLAPVLRRHIVPRSLVEETYLEAGDVTYTGNGPNGSAIRIGVEVKRVGDVLTCIQDGRFAGMGGQLERMHRDYDLSWLVIEEDLRPDPSSGVLMRRLQFSKGRVANARKTVFGRKRTSVRVGSVDTGRYVPALFGARRVANYGDLVNWLTSIQIQSLEMYRKPLFVWRVSSADELAQWIVSQYHYWNGKKYEQHKSMHLFNTSLWDKAEATGRRKVGFVSETRKRRAKAVAVLNGVGYEKAMNLSSRFTSIHEMFNAEIDDLTVPATVVGGKRKNDAVGKKLATKLYEQIREEDKKRNT